MEDMKKEISIEEIAVLQCPEFTEFISLLRFTATTALVYGDRETVDAIEQFLQLVRQFDFTVKEYDTSGFKRGEYKELGGISTILGLSEK